MSILDFVNFFGPADNAMARKSAAAATNDRLVTSYANRFISNGTDRDGFERVLSELTADRGATVVDVIAIAHSYNGGGKKPASRKAAFESISKRFVEIVRYHKKNVAAAKARPW